jgi:hypothetical protein
MAHTCHACGCTQQTSPEMFMCGRHWRMVPEHLKRAIWANYRPGQEHTKDPSLAYLNAAMEARSAVTEAERAVS